MTKPVSSLLFLLYLAKNVPFDFTAFLYAASPMIPMYGNTSAGITGNSTCSHNIINSQRRAEEKKRKPRLEAEEPKLKPDLENKPSAR
jgi:hypothetical protein